MPYIKSQDRNQIKDKNININTINYDFIETAGELQYAIAVMLKSYIERKGLSYQCCNDIMGALAGAQMEFYRRTVAPYEDEKIKEHGDV